MFTSIIIFRRVRGVLVGSVVYLCVSLSSGFFWVYLVYKCIREIFFLYFFLSSVGFFCGYSFSMCFVVFVLSIFFYLGSRYFVKFCSFRLICEVLLICSVNSCSFFAYELYISVTYIFWFFILTVLYFSCPNSFVFYIFFFFFLSYFFFFFFFVFVGCVG